jgi:hypothetical protein
MPDAKVVGLKGQRRKPDAKAVGLKEQSPAGYF